MTAQTTPSVSSIPSYLSMVSVHMMKTEFVNFGPENPITQTLDVSDLVLTGQLFFKAYSFSLHPVMLTKFHDYILQTEEVTSSSTQLDHKFRSPSMHRTALFNSIQNVFFFFFRMFWGEYFKILSPPSRFSILFSPPPLSLLGNVLMYQHVTVSSPYLKHLLSTWRTSSLSRFFLGA